LRRFFFALVEKFVLIQFLFLGPSALSAVRSLVVILRFRPYPVACSLWCKPKHVRRVDRGFLPANSRSFAFIRGQMVLVVASLRRANVSPW